MGIYCVYIDLYILMRKTMIEAMIKNKALVSRVSWMSNDWSDAGRSRSGYLKYLKVHKVSRDSALPAKTTWTPGASKYIAVNPT